MLSRLVAQKIIVMHYQDNRAEELQDILSDVLDTVPPTPNALRQLFDWLLWAQQKKPSALA